MAKALINKGIPIKADNPKDPYIMDASGINNIINANTTFGKTLGTSDSKIQLKNGDTVLSEVDAFSLYTESQQQMSGGSEIITSTTPNTYNGSALTDPFEVGKYYVFWTYGEAIAAHNILTVVDNYDNPTTTLSIDCSDIDNDIFNLYFKVTAIDGGNITAVGYASQPTEKVYYERPIKVGNNLSIENDTLNSVSSSSSAGVFTYTANFSSGNAYHLDSSEVATEIYNKLNNNEDVQIILAKNNNKYIARCVGYYKGEMEGEEYIEDPCYYFTAVINDLPRGELVCITFDLYSGNAALAITETVLNNNV